MAGAGGPLRSHLFDAALTAILASARSGGCRLVFAVERDAPWPVELRAEVSVSTVAQNTYETSGLDAASFAIE